MVRLYTKRKKVFYMIPYLFNIGPFYFNMYGFCIAIGLLTFLWAAGNDKLAKKYLKTGQLSNIALFGLIMGILGGRILNMIQDPAEYKTFYDFIALWQGGLSLQGTVLAIALTLPIYLYIVKIKILPVLDLAGLYAPLLQSISRLGCFCAGCCYGCSTTVPWAIIYTHPDSRALLHTPCHPTQIYSALSLFILFLIIRFGLRRFLKKPGQLFSIYLIGSSLERFVNDFFRAEHYEELFPATTGFSANQIIALCLLGIGLLCLVVSSSAKTKPYSV